MFELYFSYLSFFVSHFGPSGLALAYIAPTLALVALAFAVEKNAKK